MSKRVVKLAVCAIALLGATLALQAAEAVKPAEKAAQATAASATPAAAPAQGVQKQPVSCNEPGCTQNESKFNAFAAILTKPNQELFNAFTKDQKVAALTLAGYIPGKATEAKLLTPDESVQKVAATLK